VVVRIDQSQANMKRIIDCDWFTTTILTTTYDYVYAIVKRL